MESKIELIEMIGLVGTADTKKMLLAFELQT